MFHRVWQTFHQKTVPKTSYNLDTFLPGRSRQPGAAPRPLRSRDGRRARACDAGRHP